MAKVKCPGCQAAVEVDPKKGPTALCDECGKTFKLVVKKPAPAGAAAPSAPRKAAPPLDDDEDEDDEPVRKVKKKKKSRKSSGTPIWVFPVVGVAVLAGIIATIVFVVVPTMKRGLLFDPLASITDDVDTIAVVHPKDVSGASGMSAMSESMKGGGSHYAPTPPEGFGWEPGHVSEAIRVTKGVKSYHIIYCHFAAKATTPPVATHRDVAIRADKPKHLNKERFVVAGRNHLALFDSLEDAKAGIDRMLDNKQTGFYPKVKWAAYFTRTPGKMQDIFTTGMGPDIDKPKTVYVELSYKDTDFKVTYTLDYGSPEAVEKAKASIKKCHEAVRAEIAEFWKKNPLADGNPFFVVDGLMNLPLETEGGKLILVRKFAKTAEGPSFPLIREAFAMGDAPSGGFDDDEMMGKFKGKKR
jgi:hypothetical protein